MKFVRTNLIRLLAIIIASGNFFIPWGPALPARASEIGLADPSQPAQTLSLPVRFEENVGQASPDILFYGRSHGVNVGIKSDQAVLEISDGQKIAPIAFKPVGAKAATPKAEEKLVTKTNYLTARGSNNQLTDISNFGVIRYKNIYDGIDLVYRGNGGKLEYDFEVAPSADPSRIKLEIYGASSLALEAGELVVKTPAGTLIEKAPVSYQETSAGRQIVASAFALAGNIVSFNLGAYDRSLPLVIDPVLAYSSYVGGSADSEDVKDVATDNLGYTYVAGNTYSSDIVPSPIFLPSGNLVAGGDITGGASFVLKLNPTGDTVVYATYIGGSTHTSPDSGGQSWVRGVTVNSAGQLYVVGSTNQTTFPVTSGAYQVTCGCGTYGQAGSVPDVYALRLNAAGSAIDFATYLGGTQSESATGVGLDASGNIYVGGTTGSEDFSTTSGAYQPAYGHPSDPYGQYNDGFIVKLNPTATSALFSTYAGGQYYDELTGFAVDSSGNSYFSGFVGTSQSGEGVLHAAKLNTSGTALDYDHQIDGIGGITYEAVDANGNAYITGWQDCYAPFTSSAGVFQPVCAGAYDAFALKLASDGTQTYATFLGGSYYDYGRSIAVDPDGNAYITGSTSSSDFPVHNAPYGTHSTYNQSGEDAFMSKVGPDGSVLEYSTYVGGSLADTGYDISIDPSNNIIVAGSTGSDDYPITTGVFDPTMHGGSDGFIMKLGASDAAVVPAGSTQTVHIEPQISGEAGIVATVVNNTAGSGNVTLTVERLGLSKKSDKTTMDIGGQLVDLQVLGADASDTVTASFYYPDTLTAEQENNLELTYIDNAGKTKAVKSHDNVNPTKTKEHHLDNTKAKGKISVLFASNSSPKITEITGTIFASLNSVPGNLYQLRTEVAGLGLSPYDAYWPNRQLNAAMDDLAHGKRTDATNEMQAFVNSMNIIVNNFHHLTAAKAAPVIGYAQKIIGNIPSYKPGGSVWNDAKLLIDQVETSTYALPYMPASEKHYLIDDTVDLGEAALEVGDKNTAIAKFNAYRSRVYQDVGRYYLFPSDSSALRAKVQSAIDLLNSAPAYPLPPQ